MDVFITSLAALVGSFFGGIFSEKGKNLALKDDIGKITKIVEDIKTSNAELLQLQNAKHLLRMAAIDKRLETHQQAFSFLRKLNSPHLSKE
jgi:hypothetical protein